jgi:two-component system phosphate regulon sensor histidine kinase PhoR
MMMKIKLHWKLTFIFCAAAFLGLLIGYVYLSNHLKSYLEDNLQKKLEYELALSKDFLESKITGSSPLEIDALADQIGKDLNLRATIISENGKVIGDTDLNFVDLQKAENHMDRPEVQQARTQGLGISKRYSYTIKKYLLYMAIPFEKNDVKGFLRFAMPISDIDLLEGRMEKIVLLALFLVLALSLLFTFLISWSVSRPLRAMADVAKCMAQGDFSKKPSIYSRDEIGELAMALTYMSEQIQEKIKTIKQEGAKLDAVLSSMLEGIMVIDEKGGIILMNPSLRKIFLVGGDPEGKKLLEVIQNVQVQSLAEKILNNKIPWAQEEISVNVPVEKILMINGVPIKRNEKLEGAVLVFHDITELRRLEKVRQDFVANVSHELRTPIASIKGYAETLLDGALEDKNHAKEFVHIIYQDSNRLASLINDLLDL